MVAPNPPALAPFRCRHCHALLGWTLPHELRVGDVRITGRAVLACGRCGRQTTWRRSGPGKSQHAPGHS